MPKLTDSLRDWNSERFAQTLKREVEALGVDDLPLIWGISHGGVPDDTQPISVSILGLGEEADNIQVNLGVYFTETLAGCTCGEEPISMNAYCEMHLLLDKTTAEAQFKVARD